MSICVIIFGKNAGYIKANYVAQENAGRFQNQPPLAVKTILESTYIDDFLDSVENEETVVTL